MGNKTRREFLQIVSVTVSATALGLTACSGGSNSGPPPINLPPPATGLVVAEARFPQGVASGDPRPDAVVLWTRVGGVTGGGSVRLDVSTDSGFASRLVAEAFPVRDEHDHCLKVRVLGLQPGTTYFYRFVLIENGAQLASATGRTRTARASGDDTPTKFLRWKA